MLVKPGQAVTADQAVVSIVPLASPLLAQILVPSSAIGFVRLGTPVVLHHQAFPYQKFGVQHGVMQSASTNALTPNEVTALLGAQPPTEALYRVFALQVGDQLFLGMAAGPLVLRFERNEQLGVVKTGSIAAVIGTTVLRHGSHYFRMLEQDALQFAHLVFSEAVQS